MRRLLLIGIIAFLPLLAAAAGADEPESPETAKAELKKFEGTWEGYAVEDRGQRPDRGPVHLRLVVKDNQIHALDLGAEPPKEMGQGTFQLDPTKSVKEIDAAGVILPGKRERSFPGIYELEGDTFKWCVDNRGKERPAEFRTNAGKYLLILKRQK